MNKFIKIDKKNWIRKYKCVNNFLKKDLKKMLNEINYDNLINNFAFKKT